MLISLALSAAVIFIRIPALVIGGYPEPVRLGIGLIVVLASDLLVPLAACYAYYAHMRHRRRVFATIAYEAYWAQQRVARRAKPMRYEIQSGLRSPSGKNYLKASKPPAASLA